MEWILWTSITYKTTGGKRRQVRFYVASGQSDSCYAVQPQHARRFCSKKAAMAFASYLRLTPYWKEGEFHYSEIKEREHYA